MVCFKLGSSLPVTAPMFVPFQVQEQVRRERDLPSTGLCAPMNSRVRFMLAKYVELSSRVCGESLDLHSELFKIHMMQKIV